MRKAARRCFRSHRSAHNDLRFSQSALRHSRSRSGMRRHRDGRECAAPLENLLSDDQRRRPLLGGNPAAGGTHEESRSHPPFQQREVAAHGAQRAVERRGRVRHRLVPRDRHESVQVSQRHSVQHPYEIALVRIRNCDDAPPTPTRPPLPDLPAGSLAERIRARQGDLKESRDLARARLGASFVAAARRECGRTSARPPVGDRALVPRTVRRPGASSARCRPRRWRRPPSARPRRPGGSRRP